MLNNKKTATGFICLGVVAIVAAIIVSAVLRKPFYRTDIPKELDEAVARSVFSMNGVSVSDIEVNGQTVYYAEIRDSEAFISSECLGEGHIVLGYSVKGDSVEAYTVCSSIGYGFRDGMFLDNSGSFCVPTLIRFDRTEKGQYIFKDAQESMDGGEFVSSIRRMFPAALADKAIAAQNDEILRDSLHDQCDVCAAAYLRAIGREAKVGSYVDEDYKLLSDYGVSDDVCNKLLKLRPEYGFILGNFERIENNVRYVYSVKWNGDDNGNGTVTYSKTVYGKKKPTEKFSYKVKGDKLEKVGSK